MADKPHLYLISADPVFIDRFKGRLNQVADLNVFRSAQECHDGLAIRRPDLILLDTALPNDTAFAFHRSLRDDLDTSDLVQVLICDPADLSRDGYDADDQILKPVDEVVFERKLQQLLKLLAHRASANEQMAYAQGVALTAMSSMGELGVVMAFLSKSFACHNMQSVASLALDSLRQYDLEGTVFIVWEGDELSLTTGGGPLPDETRTLIAQRRTLGRILEIESRFIVNFSHVSLLVTNMPDDDSQRRGRIRDNVATLAEGIESRVQGLLLEDANLLKQQGIRYAIWEIRDSVQGLDVRQTADLAQSQALVNQLIDDFEDAFLHIALAPEVENRLIGQLVDLRHGISEIVGRPGQVHEKLQAVVTALETLAGEVA